MYDHSRLLDRVPLTRPHATTDAVADLSLRHSSAFRTREMAGKDLHRLARKARRREGDAKRMTKLEKERNMCL